MAAPTSRPPPLRRASGLSTPRYTPSYSRERERHRCRHARPCLAEAAADVVAPPLHWPPRASSPLEPAHTAYAESPMLPSARWSRRRGQRRSRWWRMRRWSRARDDTDRGARTAGTGPRVEGGSQRGGDSGAGVVALAAMSGAGGGRLSEERPVAARPKARASRPSRASGVRQEAPSVTTSISDRYLPVSTAVTRPRTFSRTNLTRAYFARRAKLSRDRGAADRRLIGAGVGDRACALILISC